MANETVLFKRGDSVTITSTPVTDGQILFDTSGNGKMYLDNGTDRLEMGGAITVDASLSKTSTNAIQNKAVTGNILNSLAEVSAATQQNTIAGALALKEVNSSLENLNLATFPNINDVITTLNYSGSYTATEDCVVIGRIIASSTLSGFCCLGLEDDNYNAVAYSIAGSSCAVNINLKKDDSILFRGSVVELKVLRLH